MGKRSDFARRERGFYPTPEMAVDPLLPHLAVGTRFVEPCAGTGELVHHLEDNLMHCVGAYDIEMRASPFRKRLRHMDALRLRDVEVASATHIITNPPWDRKILHPMIEHFSAMKPTWLLFDADWVHTKQAAPYLPLLVKIVSVGRVKWIPDSKMTGKDNCAWHLFDQNTSGATEFFGRAA